MIASGFHLHTWGLTVCIDVPVPGVSCCEQGLSSHCPHRVAHKHHASVYMEDDCWSLPLWNRCHVQTVELPKQRKTLQGLCVLWHGMTWGPCFCAFHSSPTPVFFGKVPHFERQTCLEPYLGMGFQKLPRLRFPAAGNGGRSKQLPLDLTAQWSHSRLGFGGQKDGENAWAVFLDVRNLGTGSFGSIFFFHPKNLGKWFSFDDNIFQMGWFNHQLVHIFYFGTSGRRGFSSQNTPLQSPELHFWKVLEDDFCLNLDY